MTKAKKSKEKSFCICYTELPVSRDVVVNAKNEKEALQKFTQVLGKEVASIDNHWEVEYRE